MTSQRRPRTQSALPEHAGALGSARHAGGARGWDGCWDGSSLPGSPAKDGVVCSANEARPSVDGRTLATLAQPSYRRGAIRDFLCARRDHDVHTFQELQLNLHSRQAELLAPLYRAALPDGRLKVAIERWDSCYGPDSIGAHAFEIVHRAARGALAPELGGPWFTHMLDNTEISVWWCRAIDALLLDEGSWTGPRGERLHRALSAVSDRRPERWGDVQQVVLRNMVLGGLPRFLGLDHGPFPLPGSIATVCQGNLVPTASGPVACGPAYRFVTSLDEDAAYTASPAGVNGSRFSGSYTRWTQDYLQGRYHRIEPPGRRA